ncbi:MAG TPA: glycosyltransferase, partial [Actinomycetota bacterium]|nr:glycosyltransferase [Actinomycetota bacterium]
RRDVLHPPPPFGHLLQPGPYEDYVLYVGRLESIKRPDLAVRAMQYVDEPIRLLVVGDGTHRRQTEELAQSLGLSGRVRFLGAVEEALLVDLYKRALAVVFTPFDEDYGYVTLEGFAARRPVVTLTDSGGPLEFVEDGETGIVAPPDPRAIAGAFDRLFAHRELARRLGEAGRRRVEEAVPKWPEVVERLLA